jgi:gamma-glutamyltranspeptidase
MTRGAVATPHHAATAAGERALATGGNAVDAALAAAAVLTVVYPHNSALGGDLFALVRAPDGTIASVNASGPAGSRADAGALRRDGSSMPITGPATVTVPGLVAGWSAIHALGATREWADALRDAIAHAEGGAPVARSLGDAIAEADLSDPGLADVFAPGGRRLATGDVLQQPALAATLRALSAGGARALYTGAIAAALAAVPGVAFTAGDLAAFTPERTPPLSATVAGVAVHTSPPNSSGVLLLQALATLDRLGLEDPLGADADALAEVFRRGAADRDAYLGDPRAGASDGADFLAPDRLLAERPPPFTVQRRPRPTGDTVAVVASDEDGRAVSLIQSLFHGFGSGILEPATGIILHNRGAFFSLTPDHPNLLAPGRRPAHTLMPVLVTDPTTNALRGVLGTMGGRVHAQILTQVLLRLLRGDVPQHAVDEPRWIVGGMELGERDDTVRIEDGVPFTAHGALAGAGIPVIEEPRGSEWMGHAQAIWHGAAATDRRADGKRPCEEEEDEDGG